MSFTLLSELRIFSSSWLVHIRDNISYSLLLSILAALIVNGIYNKYLHPLSHFPGPYWAGVTDLYKFYTLYSRDISSLALQQHQKYGPVVRVSPNMLSFSDVEMIPIIYHRSLDKDAFWSPGALGEHPSLIQTVDRKQHAEKRTLFAPTMSMKVLLKLEDGIDSAVTKLLDTFKNDAKRGRSSNFSYHARCYVHESTLRLLFGSRPNVEHRRDTPRLLSAARSVAMPFCLTALFPYLMVPFMRVPFLKYLIVPRSQDKRGFGQMMAHRNHLISLSESEPQPCIYANIQAHRHLRPSVTNADISAELLLLMAAAPDTTSPLASALLTSILTCPHTLHAVLAELAAAVSTNALHPSHPAPWAAISRLPYFMACVHEAARLYPSIPVLLPRCVGPAGMVLPDGRFVPASTAVAAAPAVINRDEGMFGKDAAVWRPERWLEEREQGGRMQRFLFTWGWGARKCAGKNVALLECCKLVVQLFLTFEIESTVRSVRAARKEVKGFALYDDLHVFFREKSLGGG